MGTTLTFNPEFDAAIIEKALEQDPERYGAEYLCTWRDDLSTFIIRDLLDAAVDKGVIVRPPAEGIRYFVGGDASGGRNDAFTSAVAHRESDGTIVLDAILERKAPFNPTDVVGEIVALMRQYRCQEITGDNYAAGWVAEAFGKAGVRYIKSDRDRSGVYLDMLPLLTSGRARLLDHQRLVAQLVGLERRTARGGRDSIDHAPGAHDDVANAVAGALTSVASCNTFAFTPEMAAQIAAWPKNRGGFPYSREKYPFTWNPS
jgi:hypothetical protein